MTSELGCFCQTQGMNCGQGRRCPLMETEAANDVPLDATVQFPAPKGKRMNYRLSRSPITGRAPRTLNAAFGCDQNDPVHPMPDPDAFSLADFFVAVGQVFSRVFARLFCR